MARRNPLGANPLQPETEEGVLRHMIRGDTAPADPEPPPAGAKTTVTPGGLLRKTVYFSPEEWAQIRERCYREDLKYTQVVRAAVREYLGLGA